MTDPAATVLVVEDDGPTRTFLADNLAADGYELAHGRRRARSASSPRGTASPISGWSIWACGDGSGLDLGPGACGSADGVVSLASSPHLPLVIVYRARRGRLDRVRGFEGRGRMTSSQSPSPTPSCGAAAGRGVLRRAQGRRLRGPAAGRGARAGSGHARSASGRAGGWQLGAKGVRAPASPGRGAARVFTKRESCCGTSGASKPLRLDANAGFPRLPPAAQARLGVRGERVGGRLSARGRCAMSRTRGFAPEPGAVLASAAEVACCFAAAVMDGLGAVVGPAVLGTARDVRRWSASLGGGLRFRRFLWPSCCASGCAPA